MHGTTGEQCAAECRRNRGERSMMRIRMQALAAVLGLTLVSLSTHASTIIGLYYVAESQIRVVPFDGTGFTGFASSVVNINPTWDAMSYDPDAGLMYYVAESQIRVVPFDGTGFTGFASSIVNINPNWDAMSYDVDAGLMYYVAESQIRVVPFDGTAFTGFASSVVNINPNWDAMSYDVEANMMYYVAEGQLRVVGFDGTGFTGFATGLENVNPNWEAMALIFAPDPQAIPEAPSLALLGFGLAALGLRRWQPRGQAIAASR
jgi:hypothetical protein